MPKENMMKAFPNMTTQQGMDLRDYFAAQVMQALIQASASLNPKGGPEDYTEEEFSFEHAAHCGFNSEIGMTGEEADGTEFKYTWARNYVEEAYTIADEMMRQRERK
jgi:hypothetical protein